MYVTTTMPILCKEKEKKKFSSAKAKKLGQADPFCRSGAKKSINDCIYHYNHCY